MKRAQGLHLVFAACILFVSLGCSLKGGQPDSWQPIKKKDMPVVHIVKYPKETLPMIAKWYTGDIRNWEHLADANPNINPDHLSVGNEIFIPDPLVKTREPMPGKFVLKHYQKPKQKKRSIKSGNVSPARSKKEDDEEFEIFGPK